MQIFKRIISIVVIIILLPILFVSATILIDSYAHPDKVPSFFGWKPFIVLSGSMETQISAGDVVVVKETETQNLKKGDIIAFKEGDIVITHRIDELVIEDGNVKYITKGDNNQSVDIGSITRENIVGKMIYKINGLGKIQFFLSSKLGWILIILIPALCFILYDLNKLNKIFKIKKKIDKIPEYQNMSAKEEIEHNKKVRALLEKSKWMK